MDEEAFFSDSGVVMMFEAVLHAAGFRRESSRYNCSPDLSPIRKRSVSPESRKGEVEVLPCERFNGRQNNYSEIAEKNARELINQEEQARLKAEKKRAKKERQKQKKKETFDNNCPNKDNTINIISNDMENLAFSPNNKEAEGLDVNAAFVSKAIKKVKNSTIIPEDPKSKNKKDVKDINSIIKTALDYENKEHYKEAVQYLSEAINLSPRRFDLILKRSFIFYELAKFEKSIRDAQKVLDHAPNNIDGHYRLGEGHFAMNNLPEAEAAFTKLLSFNAYTEEASKRLFSIRIKQLEGMGYHPNEAFTALIKSKNKTLDEAIEFLTALESGNQDTDDLYYSDEDEDEEDYEEEEEEEEKDDDDKDSNGASGPLVQAASKPCIVIDKKSPLLTDPSNLVQCCSLFIGNLKKDITYKEVHDVFIKFGDITNIKLTTEPNCYAFVNYEESSSAGRAMEALQGSRWLLSTVPLVVRYPTNVVNTAISTMKYPELINKLQALQSTRPKFPAPMLMKPTFIKQIPDKPADKIVDLSSSPVVKPVSSRVRPPPKTEDCYFWRTTGCVYSNTCFNLHRPDQKGVALSPRKAPPSLQ